MSILIKGMKMPTWCNDCPFNDTEYDVCVATPDRRLINIPRWDGIRLSHREKWCPLGVGIEVPTPHGRLIDADALLELYELPETWDYLLVPLNIVKQNIKDAPTIIEAEE